jgi:predicted glutamine amidotransferase
MCGISILYNPNGSQTAVKQFMEAWMYQEHRGRDASGIFAVTNKGVLYAKAPVPASEFVPIVRDYVQRHGLVLYYALGHARAATHGSPLVNKNNHPIVRRADGEVHALIHNGVIHASVCDSKITETDTEELLCALMRYSSLGLSELANNVASSISGSYAFGYIKADDSGVKRFVVGRAVSPLEEVEVDGARLFASVLPHTVKGKQIANGTFIDPLSGESVAIERLASYSYYVPGSSYRLLTDYIEVKDSDVKPSKKKQMCIVDALGYQIDDVDVEVSFIGSCGHDMFDELLINGALDAVIYASTNGGCSAKLYGSVIYLADPLSVRFMTFADVVGCKHRKTRKKLMRAVDSAVSKMLTDIRTMLAVVEEE